MAPRGRDWSTLTALVPGAVDPGGSNPRTIRFADRGLDDHNFADDGIDATIVVNQAQQSFVRLANFRPTRLKSLASTPCY